MADWLAGWLAGWKASNYMDDFTQFLFVCLYAWHFCLHLIHLQIFLPVTLIYSGLGISLYAKIICNFSITIFNNLFNFPIIPTLEKLETTTFVQMSMEHSIHFVMALFIVNLTILLHSLIIHPQLHLSVYSCCLICVKFLISSHLFAMLVLELQNLILLFSSW